MKHKNLYITTCVKKKIQLGYQCNKYAKKRREKKVALIAVDTSVKHECQN